MVMELVFDIPVDLKEVRSVNTPLVTQNDSVVFILTVTENGIPFDLTDATTVSLTHNRQGDGTVVVTMGTRFENKATFVLNAGETSVAGGVIAKAQFYDADGRVSSLSFGYQVGKDPTGVGYTPSENEQTLIEVVLNDGPLIIASAEEAAAYATAQGDYVETKRPLIETFTGEQTNLQTQLNDLVLQSGTDIAEVVQARGGEVTLNARLDKTNQQLADKAKQTDLISIGSKIPFNVLSAPMNIGVLRNGNIVAIGDSITAGQGGTRNYPQWLEATIQGLDIKNVGLGGAKIRYHITNSSAFLSLNPKPSLAIVLIGTNDLDPDLGIAQMKIDYKELIGLLVTNNITPVLCTLLPRSDNSFIIPNLMKFNEFIREYARVNGFTLIDTFSVVANNDGTPKTGYLHTDNLHPTTFGYMRMVEAMVLALPLTVKEVRWDIPGNTNIIPTPTFIGDDDSNGRANGWLSFSSSGVSSVYSLVNHPLEGKWQQVSKTGGVDVNSLTYLYQMIPLPAGIVAGDTIIFGVDVDTDDITIGDIEVAGQWFTSAEAYISASTLLGRTGTKITNKRITKRFVVPANATKIKVLLTVYGNGNTVARYGRVLIRRIETV